MVNFPNKDLEPFYEKSKWGFIQNGKVCIEAKYTEVTPFNNGVAWVKLSFWGAIDPSDKTIIRFKYKEIHRLSIHYWILEEDKSNHKYIYRLKDNSFLLDESNEPLIISEFSRNQQECGIRIIKSGGKYGAIDSKGNLLIPIQYDDLSNFFYDYAVAVKDGSYLYVDIKGMEHPVKCTFLGRFSRFGVARYSYKGKYGLLDRCIKPIIPPVYSDLFIEGLEVKAKLHGVEYVGKIENGDIEACDIRNVSPIFKSVRKLGLYAVISSSGAYISDFIFLKVEPNNNISVFGYTEDKKYMVSDNGIKEMEDLV